MSVTAGATPAPPGGTPAVTGYLINATLLYPTSAPGDTAVSATIQAAATDVVTDCLMYAGNTPPEPGRLGTWFATYTGVLNQLGWTTTNTTRTQPGLTGGQGQPSTVIPWQSIRNQITPGPVLGGLDALVAALDTLPAPVAQRWVRNTVVGNCAVAVIAVASITDAGCQLVLTCAALTYPSNAAPPALSGYPGQPVPAAGAVLNIDQVTVQFALEQLLAVQAQLDPRVAAAKPNIATLTG